MNDLQRRLVTILRTINAPVTATKIRDKCQLPQPIDLIAANLRGLQRAGQICELKPEVWVHREYSDKAAAKAAVPQQSKQEKPMLKKVNGGKPSTHPSADKVNEELAILSDLQAMGAALQPREVLDAHLKIVTLEAMIKLSSRRVAGMLQRIIDEDLRQPVSDEV